MAYMPLEFLRPLVNGWLGKIELAKRARQPWAETAKECMAFFSEPTGFMWDPKYEGRFWSKTVQAPKFQLTIAKAFELVAIFGPTLWSNVPYRSVQPKRLPEIPLELLGLTPDPQMQMMAQQNPQMQQMLQQQMMQMQMQQQQFQQQQAMLNAEDKTVAGLMEMWLNYTPIEQAGGGLEIHGEAAVTEALIKGRGLLMPKPYKMPGSKRTLTGCFHKTVDDLFIDPDATNVEDAQWIAIRWVQPWWVAEERFQLPPGTLRRSGTLESAFSEGSRWDDPLSSARRMAGQTHDLVEYYEVWSKAGCGARLTNVETPVGQRLEEVVGKYAYCVVAPSVPFPLNAPSERFRSGASDAEVRAMFSWPVPTWTDDRWPVAMLDFYRKPNCLWPVPPMAPGLGELKFLNVMISHMCNRIWSSSRDFIAVPKHAYEELREILESGADQTILPLNEQTAQNGDITRLVSFLQQPPTNMDTWRIIEAVSELFDRRVGLTDLLYGMNPGNTQPRSAEEVSTKRSMVSVRPDYMAKKVEQWSSEAARMEAFCARFFVTGEDVEGRVGPFGRMLWERYIMSSDVERVVREMQYTVAAGSARRPNKDRDVANIGQFITQFGQVLAQHGQMTGDMTAVNGMIKIWGKGADMDVSELMLPPPPPQPDPHQLQQQQLEMQQQAEQQKAQVKQQELAMKQQAQQQKMQLDAVAQQQQLAADQQRHEQEMRQDQEEHAQEMQQDMADHALQMRVLAGKLQMDRLKLAQQAQKPQPAANGKTKPKKTAA